MAKFNFKNPIKSIFKSKGKDKSKIQFNVYRDWGILLSLFFVLLIAVAVISIYLFIQINEEKIFVKQRPVGEEIEMLNVEKLGSVIKVFNNRSENFENILKNKPEIIDPAL